jgi:multiple sugar transport system permease protein
MSDTIAHPQTSAEHAPTERARPKRDLNWGRIAAWAVMGVLLIVTLFPFYWMLRTALSTNADLVKGSHPAPRCST